MLTEKELEKYKEEIEAMKLQEDWPARNTISDVIEDIIIESNKGEIAIAEFVERLEDQIRIAKDLMAFWLKD
jgi:hypothetical protein